MDCVHHRLSPVRICICKVRRDDIRIMCGHPLMTGLFVFSICLSFNKFPIFEGNSYCLILSHLKKKKNLKSQFQISGGFFSCPIVRICSAALQCEYYRHKFFLVRNGWWSIMIIIYYKIETLAIHLLEMFSKEEGKKLKEH